MVQRAELKRKVVQGSAWIVVRNGADQVLRFMVFILLARVLSPTDFGLYALASVFIGFGASIAAGGMHDFLIRAEEESSELTSTVFWAVCLSTLTVAGSIAMASGPLAVVLGEPRLQPLIIALAAALLLGPLGAIHGALAVRHFKNAALTGIGMIQGVLSSLAALAAAYSGLGLWSLVVHLVVSTAVGTVALWFVQPWAPRLVFDGRRIGGIVRFGGNMVVASLLQSAVIRVQDLIIGGFLGATATGQYRIAGRAYELINTALVAPLSSMTLPALSRLQGDKAAFRTAFLRMTGLTSVLAVPGVFGFGAIAPDIVPLLFGPQWTPTVPVVQILALLAPVWVQGYFAGPTLAACGRSDEIRRYAALQLTATAVLALAAVRFGLEAVAWSFVAAFYLTLPLRLRWFAGATGISGRDVLAQLAPATAAGAVMAAAVVLMRLELSPDMSPVSRVASCVAWGAVVYGAVLAVAFRGFVASQIRSVRLALPLRAAA